MLSGDLNPRFFHWPSLTFYLFAGLYWCARALKETAAGVATLSATEQILIGRIVVAAAGTVTIAVVYSIGRRLRDDVSGLIAAALLAVAMLHVRESHFAMTDVIMTLLVTASLAILMGGTDQQRLAGGWDCLRSRGLLGGLATSTKYTAAAVLAAAAAAQILTLRSPWRTVLMWRAWQPSLAYAVCFVGGFLMATPYAVLDFPASAKGCDSTFGTCRKATGGPRSWRYLSSDLLVAVFDRSRCLCRWSRRFVLPGGRLPHGWTHPGHFRRRALPFAGPWPDGVFPVRAAARSGPVCRRGSLSFRHSRLGSTAHACFENCRIAHAGCASLCSPAW